MIYVPLFCCHQKLSLQSHAGYYLRIMGVKKACRTKYRKFHFAQKLSQSVSNDLKWYWVFVKGLKDSQLLFLLAWLCLIVLWCTKQKVRFSSKIMANLDLNNGQNSRKFALFIIFVDLDGLLVNMIWGAHAVSKCTLVRITSLQSLGHLRHNVQKIFQNRVRGGSLRGQTTPPHMNFRN